MKGLISWGFVLYEGLLCLISPSLWAQQEAQFSQYMFNTQMVNPAYAGSRGVPSIFIGYRKQWQGFDGAPTTAVAALQTAVPNQNMGLGLILERDALGPVALTQIHGQYAYTLRFNRDNRLSLGLQWGAWQWAFDAQRMHPETWNDPTLAQTPSIWRWSAGAGVYWRNTKAYAGVAVPSSSIGGTWRENWVIYTPQPTMYAIGGWVYSLSADWALKPCAALKMTSGAPLAVDAGLQAWWRDRWSVGCNIRWNGAVSLLAAWKIDRQWMLGYAFEAETNDIKPYQGGTHEFFLRFEWQPNTSLMAAPRYF